MNKKFKVGMIRHLKASNQIILSYANKDEFKFNDVILADLNAEPVKDDYELVVKYNNQFHEGEGRAEEYLKGFSYALKSLKAGNTIDIMVDEVVNKTHIALPPLNKEGKKWVKTYAVVDSIATLGNALLDFNVKSKQQETVKDELSL
jgi:arginyl-tRNA--protein-N-Asp/Glu arginylyltransferase